MANNRHTAKDILSKLANPAFLIISLLIARFTVDFRSAIILSAPVELYRSGLSVSMPSGNGWENTGKWIYDKDHFIFTATFSIDRLGPSSPSYKGQGESYVKCKYLLAAPRETPEQRFDELASELQGQVVETGKLQTASVLANWAKITLNDSSNVIFGICNLPAGRQLEIEVVFIEENDKSWQLCEHIIKAIRFNDYGLLQAGAELVSEARRTGLADILIQTVSEPSFSSNFIILNSQGRPTGFMLDSILAQKENTSPVRAASYYYQAGPIPDEASGTFRSDDSFEQFTWNIQTNSRSGRKAIEMNGGKESMTARFVADRQPAERISRHILGKAGIPDIVLEPVLKKFRESRLQEIIIDVIRSDGTITPVHIEKINPADKQKSYTWAFLLEILDGRGFRQQLYYDDYGPPAKIIFQQERIFIFQRANPEQIIRIFPERADIIKQFMEHND